MRINRNYRYRESLPVEERDSYQAWKKSYDIPKSVEDRKKSVRQKNSQVYKKIRASIYDIYQDLISICEHKVEDISYDDIEETLYINREYKNRDLYFNEDSDYVSLIEAVDDNGSDNDFALVASNFRPVNNPSDLFELSPRHTHVLFAIGDNLLTNFNSREFNPDTVIKEIRDNLNISRTLLSSIYDSLKYIAKNKKYYELESIGPACCTVDLGCILDFDDNYEKIRDMVLTLFLLFVNNNIPFRNKFL